jgi:HEAT repeat protein
LLLALGKLGDRAGLPVLVEHLDERDNIVQSTAITAIGLLAKPDDSEVVKQLAKIAEDEAHATNRALALIALGRIGGSQARAVLQGEINGGSRKRLLVDLRPFAASGLAIAGDPADAAYIAPHLNTPVVFNRGSYALSLALLGTAGAEPIVKMLKEEKNAMTFSELALAAGLMQATGAVDHLRNVVAHERRADFRTASAIALALMGDPKALDQVLDLIDEVKSASQQAPLVFALTLFGNQRGIDAMAQLLTQSRVQDSVKALCCVALGNIGDTRRYPALSSLSHDWSWMVSTPVLDEMVLLY